MASMSGDFGHNRLSSLGDFLQLSVVCNELLPPQSQDVWSTDVFSLLTADIQDVRLFCVSINLFFSHMQTNISGNNLVSSRILHFVLQRVLLIWNPRTIQKALTVKQEVLELLINTKGRQYKKKINWEKTLELLFHSLAPAHATSRWQDCRMKYKNEIKKCHYVGPFFVDAKLTWPLWVFFAK